MVKFDRSQRDCPISAGVEMLPVQRKGRVFPAECIEMFFQTHAVTGAQPSPCQPCSGGDRFYPYHTCEVSVCIVIEVFF